MNPQRLHALFNAYFSQHGKPVALDPAEKPEERSLSAFLMGGQ